MVVEGYTDVMAMHAAGVTTAVASCGTAFGDDHIGVLRRFLLDSDVIRGEVVYTFDGDAAGRNAALKAFDSDQKFAANTFIAVAPDNLDPCELRQKQGDAALRDLVETQEAAVRVRHRVDAVRLRPEHRGGPGRRRPGDRAAGRPDQGDRPARPVRQRAVAADRDGAGRAAAAGEGGGGRAGPGAARAARTPRERRRRSGATGADRPRRRSSLPKKSDRAAVGRAGGAQARPAAARRGRRCLRGPRRQRRSRTRRTRAVHEAHAGRRWARGRRPRRRGLGGAGPGAADRPGAVVAGQRAGQRADEHGGARSRTRSTPGPSWPSLAERAVAAQIKDLEAELKRAESGGDADVAGPGAGRPVRPAAVPAGARRTREQAGLMFGFRKRPAPPRGTDRRAGRRRGGPRLGAGRSRRLDGRHPLRHLAAAASAASRHSFPGR